jgi:lipopolysaccharide/colanic/teichoic acid biosynthesis glycosyltransferase
LRSSASIYMLRNLYNLNFLPFLPYPDQLMNQFTEMGIVVHMKMAKSSNLIGEKKFVERLGCYTVLTTSINYATAGQLFAKRAMDILGGLVGCIITGILCIILGPLIYIQSPGPIFFSQIRVGKNGKKFKLYKFRSMYMDAEERKKELMKQNRIKDGMMFKLKWDPRIIGSKITKDGTMKKGIGNLIRDFSLDEFPQFFNVLKGDMSLVGTRPPTVDEWEKYDLHHRARLAAKPGITGMWQVSGRSNITDFEDVVKLDTKYIAEWTMGLDIRILLKTVLVVFKKDGAM